MIQTATGRPKARAGPQPPAARSNAVLVVQPEPWWARYALALLKLLLAFALAVLTLIFTYSGSPPAMPPFPSVIDSPHPELETDPASESHSDSDLDSDHDKSAP